MDEELPTAARFEVQALNALKLSDDLLHDAEGSMTQNIQRAGVYATQAVALTNLALLHKDDLP